MLGRLRLLFVTSDGKQAHMYEDDILSSDLELELSESLEEHHGFDITHCSSDFHQTDIGLEACSVDWLPGHLFEPGLNHVRDMRDDLHGLPEVISTTLLVDDLAVHLPRGDVVAVREIYIKKPSQDRKNNRNPE